MIAEDTSIEMTNLNIQTHGNVFHYCKRMCHLWLLIRQLYTRVAALWRNLSIDLQA